MSTFIGLKINKVDNNKNNKPKEPTIAEIKDKLKELGIEYDDKAKKEDLIALLPKE